MPVPVPRYTKQSAHPVIKINQSGGQDLAQTSIFQHFTHSLPLPPRGLPPSFATREEWISSLPDWRRNKPRRVLEDDNIRNHLGYRSSGFDTGLTVADNASVIKGAPAQACIPPVSTLIASADYATVPPPLDMYATFEEDGDDDMSPSDGSMEWQSDDEVSPLDDGMDEDMMHSEDGALDYTSDYQSGMYLPHHGMGYGATFAPRSFERGAFSPVFEETSPGPIGSNDPASSPIGPATPFGEYVDRAVADAQITLGYDNHQRGVEVVQQPQYSYAEGYDTTQCYQCQHYQAEQPVQQVPAQEAVVTPTATIAYRKLAEPISEWVANFVWKVCTTGMSLPAEYASVPVKSYSTSPPSQLAKSTHSMLLSTLLQPSGILLALWYIVRLPVFFGPTCLGADHAKQIRFRNELLGEAHLALDRDAIESYAPFRLVVLGCMLANKWLDDHTFSNKTWHTITNVPIRSLNQLESLALDLFEHNLSIPTDEWSCWLKQLLSYHVSLSSPAFPQPIGRPSTSPHTIIRKSIETLMGASPPAHDGTSATATPQPVFLGTHEHRRESLEREQAYREENIDVLEIDLDEDGPLREEYLPRRRISGAGSSRSVRSQERTYGMERTLPPPARWSPEADEPITRSQLRSHAQYVAPQPISHIPVQAAPPAPFHQALDAGRRIWPVDNYAAKLESITRPTYAPAPVFTAPQPSYLGYECRYQPPQSHVRSQSLFHNPPMASQPQGHLRSYSQSIFDGGYSDVRFSEPRYSALPPPNNHWSHFDRSSYPNVYDCPLDFAQRTSLRV